MKKYLPIAILLFFFGCNQAPYIATSDNDMDIVSRAQEGAAVEYTVPAGEYVALKKQKKGYYQIKHEGKVGYVYKPKYKKRRRLRNWEYDLYTTYTTFYGPNSNNSPSYNSEKPVHVKGYYRKNGTYVQPHTRSAPQRR